MKVSQTGALGSPFHLQMGKTPEVNWKAHLTAPFWCSQLKSSFPEGPGTHSRVTKSPPPSPHCITYGQRIISLPVRARCTWAREGTQHLSEGLTSEQQQPLSSWQSSSWDKVHYFLCKNDSAGWLWAIWAYASTDVHTEISAETEQIKPCLWTNTKVTSVCKCLSIQVLERFRCSLLCITLYP